MFNSEIAGNAVRAGGDGATAGECQDSEDEKMISRAVVFRRQVVQVPCITTGPSRLSDGQNECIQTVDLAPPCTLRACTSHLWLSVISTLMCSSPGRKKVFEMRTRWLRVHGEIMYPNLISQAVW